MTGAHSMNELQRIERQNNSLEIIKTLDFNIYDRFIEIGRAACRERV